jgi:Domain of unknown function (DUF6883)
VKLPQPEAVQIDASKVRAYLLSQTHPVGRFKARVFAAVGFDDTKVDDFIAEVRRIATVGDVAEVEDFEYGRKYTVPGELTGSTGSLQVVTVWIQEPGRADVRLVTVRPR